MLIPICQLPWFGNGYHTVRLFGAPLLLCYLGSATGSLGIGSAEKKFVGGP